MTEAELDNCFTYHAPHGDQLERYKDIRDTAKGLADLINSRCPECREKKLAMQKVESAVMWANAGIARHL